MLAQETQVVIGGVKNEFVGVQRVEERIQIDGCEGIDQFITVDSADLDQAYFFGIGMKTVGFGVNREPDGGTDHREEGRELFVGINH